MNKKTKQIKQKTNQTKNKKTKKQKKYRGGSSKNSPAPKKPINTKYNQHKSIVEIMTRPPVEEETGSTPAEIKLSEPKNAVLVSARRLAEEAGEGAGPTQLSVSMHVSTAS